MTDVTGTGRRSCQAIAIWERLSPRWRANRCSFFILGRLACTSALFKKPLRAARELLGIPSRYRSESCPCAKGEKLTTPHPTVSKSGKSSCSGSRTNME